MFRISKRSSKTLPEIFKTPKQSSKTPSEIFQDPKTVFKDPFRDLRDPKTVFKDPSRDLQNPKTVFKDTPRDLRDPKTVFDVFLGFSGAGLAAVHPQRYAHPSFRARRLVPRGARAKPHAFLPSCAPCARGRPQPRVPGGGVRPQVLICTVVGGL